MDLGTTNTRIAIKNKGIVLREPSVVGLNTKTNEYVFFGQEAKKITGKTPEFIKVQKPLVNGVIHDFDSEVALIKKFMDKAVAPYQTSKLYRQPTRIISIVPSIATEIEQRAVEEVASKIGASKIFLVPKPIAVAAGTGIDIFSHQPNLIIDLGGGLIEMAILSGGGIVVKKTLRNAGEHMNHLISNYCYLKYGIILGEITVEEIKTQLLNFTDTEEGMTVRGKSLENGLPKSIKLKSSEVKEALLSNLNQIIDAAKELIEISPPEVVEEIYNRGVVLAGGITQAPGIENFFTKELKIDSFVRENPQDAVINGLLKLTEHEENLERVAIKNI